MISDVLFDHRDELTKILEVVFLKTDGTRSHNVQESGKDLTSNKDVQLSTGGEGMEVNELEGGK